MHFKIDYYDLLQFVYKCHEIIFANDIINYILIQQTKTKFFKKTQKGQIIDKYWKKKGGFGL